MGITIHYRFARKQEPERFLNRVAVLAERLNMTTVERSWNKLILDPGKGSEAISLHWHKVKTIKGRSANEWDYEKSTLTDIGSTDDEMWFCSGFTKTQYAGVQVHVRVAELLRFVAGHCPHTCMSDEADYYENVGDKEAIKNLASAFDESSKMIGELTLELKEVFGGGNVVTGEDLAA